MEDKNAKKPSNGTVQITISVPQAAAKMIDAEVEKRTTDWNKPTRVDVVRDVLRSWFEDNAPAAVDY